MDHPAEIAAAMHKEAGFWAAIPWIMMALPFATQLIDRFRGGSEAGKDPFEQLQVQRFGKPQSPHGFGAQQPSALRQTAQGLHGYRAGY